jgi:hypothetical protein
LLLLLLRLAMLLLLLLALLLLQLLLLTLLLLLLATLTARTLLLLVLLLLLLLLLELTNTVSCSHVDTHADHMRHTSHTLCLLWQLRAVLPLMTASAACVTTGAATALDAASAHRKPV